ncbi:hypothetical protein HCZ02_01865 [Limosilactobacillus fermentum]
MPRPKTLSDKQREDHAKKSRDRWNAANRDKGYRYQKKSRAKRFIKKDASLEELQELRSLIDDRITEMRD